jgi:hypothetical protein
MTRLAYDAGTVSATRQHESDIIGRDEMDLVDRAPRSNVIGNSADSKARDADVGAFNLEMAPPPNRCSTAGVADTPNAYDKASA